MAAVLAVTPYYNRPSPAGLSAHFRAVAAATDLPVILYDIPVRSGRRIGPALTVELAREVPNIVGVKDATGDVAAAAAGGGREPGRSSTCTAATTRSPCPSSRSAVPGSSASPPTGPVRCSPTWSRATGRGDVERGHADQPAPGRVVPVRVHRRLPQPGAGQGRLPGPRAPGRPVPPAQRPRPRSLDDQARSVIAEVGPARSRASRLPDPTDRPGPPAPGVRVE